MDINYVIITFSIFGTVVGIFTFLVRYLLNREYEKIENREDQNERKF